MKHAMENSEGNGLSDFW